MDTAHLLPVQQKGDGRYVSGAMAKVSGATEKVSGAMAKVSGAMAQVSRAMAKVSRAMANVSGAIANELCEVGWAWTGEEGRFSQGAVTSEVDMCIRSAGLEGLPGPVAKIKGL